MATISFFSFQSLEELKWLDHESPISRKEGWGFLFQLSLRQKRQDTALMN
jgi:hypothetical protein